MAGFYSVKAHYLDASALVKLVADDVDEEPGRTALRQYYHHHPVQRTTSYCLTEALSAFKLKYLRGRISQDQYVRYVKDFIGNTIGANVRVDEVSILNPIVRSEAERLIKYHDIDFLDAFQIVTIMHGRNCHMKGPSRSILITADRTLARAARVEGARVWECTAEPAPSDGDLEQPGI